MSLLDYLKKPFNRKRQSTYQPQSAEESSVLAVLEEEGRLTTVEIVNKTGFSSMHDLETILFNLWGPALHRWPNLVSHDNPYWASKDYQPPSKASAHVSGKGRLYENQRQMYPPQDQIKTSTQS